MLTCQGQEKTTDKFSTLIQLTTTTPGNSVTLYAMRYTWRMWCL